MTHCACGHCSKQRLRTQIAEETDPEKRAAMEATESTVDIRESESGLVVVTEADDPMSGQYL